MKTNEVFKETVEMEEELIELKKRLKEIDERSVVMMALCPHELVFKHNIKHPGMIIRDADYYCPACGKTIRCIDGGLPNTRFNNSRVISLLNLSLLGTKELYQTIKNEVYQNMGLYYNQNISDEFLSCKMEEILKDQECEYKGYALRRKL